MIIDSEKNLEKQLNKFNKIYSKMEGSQYFRFDAFKEMGFSDVSHFRDCYKNNWLSKLLNKSIKEKEKMIKAFKAGSLPGTSKNLWIEQQSFLKNMFIVDSSIPSEKASFIYAKQLLKKNKKILYIAQDKECIDEVRKFTEQNKIDCVIAEKICLRICKIDLETYSVLSVMLNTNSAISPLTNISVSDRMDMLIFFLGSYFELTKEGVERIMDKIPADLSSVNPLLQKVYAQVRPILIDKLNKIKPFLSQEYNKREDIFLNLVENNSMVASGENKTIAQMIAVLARIYFLELLSGKQGQEGYKYPKLIFPDVETEEGYGNFYFNISSGRPVQMVNFIYSNKENNYVKNNTAIFMKHINRNLYHIKTSYDDAIVEVKE